MSISARAFAPRWRRSSRRSWTSPSNASRWCSATARSRPIRGRRSPARRSSSAPIPLRRAAAQARRFLVGRAAAILGDRGGGADRRGRRRPAARGRQSPPELWRADRRGADPACACRRYAGQGRLAPIASWAPRRRAWISRPRPRAVSSMSTTCAARACCTGASSGRLMRASNSGDHVGRSLIRVDEASIASLPGIVATVVLGDFVGDRRRARGAGRGRDARAEGRVARRREAAGPVATSRRR